MSFLGKSSPALRFAPRTLSYWEKVPSLLWRGEGTFERSLKKKEGHIRTMPFFSQTMTKICSGESQHGSNSHRFGLVLMMFEGLHADRNACAAQSLIYLVLYNFMMYVLCA
jgi:hypothetical protein